MHLGWCWVWSARKNSFWVGIDFAPREWRGATDEPEGLGPASPAPGLWAADGGHGHETSSYGWAWPELELCKTSSFGWIINRRTRPMVMRVSATASWPTDGSAETDSRLGPWSGRGLPTVTARTSLRTWPGPGGRGASRRCAGLPAPPPVGSAPDDLNPVALGLALDARIGHHVGEDHHGNDADAAARLPADFPPQVPGGRLHLGHRAGLGFGSALAVKEPAVSSQIQSVAPALDLDGEPADIRQPEGEVQLVRVTGAPHS